MIRKIFLPALAALGMLFAVYSVVTGQRQVPPARPVTEPAQPQYASYVAGAGIVEASTENIAVGTFVPGVVTEVFVKVGDNVKAGAPLFKVDDRDLQAELEVRKAALKSAAANVATANATLCRAPRFMGQLQRTLIVSQRRVLVGTKDRCVQTNR